MNEEIGSNDRKQLKGNEVGGVNLGRHQAQCSICLSSYRQQIDELFIDWVSPYLIAKQYTGISPDSVYRHAHACDLFGKRRANILMALEKIIEGADRTPMEGSQIVSAIKIYVKLIGSGKGPEHVQATDPKKLLERMSQEEREAFARDGSLPDWFSSGEGATPGDSQEGEKESEVTETKRVQ